MILLSRNKPFRVHWPTSHAYRPTFPHTGSMSNPRRTKISITSTMANPNLVLSFSLSPFPRTYIYLSTQPTNNIHLRNPESLPTLFSTPTPPTQDHPAPPLKSHDPHLSSTSSAHNCHPQFTAPTPHPVALRGLSHDSLIIETGRGRGLWQPSTSAPTMECCVEAFHDQRQG